MLFQPNWNASAISTSSRRNQKIVGDNSSDGLVSNSADWPLDFIQCQQIDGQKVVLLSHLFAFWIIEDFRRRRCRRVFARGGSDAEATANFGFFSLKTGSPHYIPNARLHTFMCGYMYGDADFRWIVRLWSSVGQEKVVLRIAKEQKKNKNRTNNNETRPEIQSQATIAGRSVLGMISPSGDEQSRGCTVTKQRSK